MSTPTPSPRTMRRSERPASDEPEEVVSFADSSDEGGVVTPIRSGWSAGQKEMDSGSGFAQALILDQNIQIIQFLDDQPYASYRRHWIDRQTPQGVKKRTFTCLESVGRSCPLCEVGDRPQAVSAFNVALIGDDGQPLLKTFDVGARLFNQLKAFANDPKIAPLSKGYYAVSKTGKGGTVSHTLIPIRPHSLESDYDIVPPTDAEIRSIGKYDPSIIPIPKRSDLEEIAQEIQDYE